MRTPSNKDWQEKRSVGRREADRGVCMFHDMCHETISTMRQNCINNIESHKEDHHVMEADMKAERKSKLDWKVFALFVTGAVTICVAFVFFVAPLFLKMAQTVTRIDTNQQHLMQEFQIDPVKK